MCGFLAEFCFEQQPLTESQEFGELLALSKHRGPDATDTLRSDVAQLGFNRLAILDLSPKGNQPMTSASHRFQMVFNGEIYNYKELIATHQLHGLTSTSDSEVIVQLCDTIGIEATIAQLNGMFAIAIIDTVTEELYMCRDFAGIKPHFYGIGAQGVVCASQFDQVFKHAWFQDSLELQPEIVKEYFGFGYMQAPHTIYKNIFQVNPGELIQVNRQGAVIVKSVRCFQKELTHTKAVNGNSLGPIIKQAVKRQLVSDVPVASFLSGGIDSPLISAYAKQQKEDIEVFTLKVNDPKLNESDIAEAYAKHLQLKQQVVGIEKEQMLTQVDEHFKAYSEPFGDYSSIPTFAISKAAKKRHTVMLSGDGGDELFFGYPRMLDLANKKIWFLAPLWLRKLIAKVTNTLKITNTYVPYLKDLNAMVVNKHSHIPKPVLDRILPNTDFSAEMQQKYHFKNTKRSQFLQQLRWNEFYAHMQRILVKVDRASMAHSLEVRVPFLDKEVITAAWQMEGHLQTKDDLKADLKLLLKQEVPEALINTKKMGFSVPIADWLRTHLKSDVEQKIFKDAFYGASVLNVEAIQDYVKTFFEGKHDNAWGIWHIYAWQKWSEAHCSS